MRAWQRALLGALLVGAVAVAGIALNFTLLRLTQDAHDPVGQAEPARGLLRPEARRPPLPVDDDDRKRRRLVARKPVTTPEPGDGDSDD